MIKNFLFFVSILAISTGALYGLLPTVSWGAYGLVPALQQESVNLFNTLFIGGSLLAIFNWKIS